jgi:hypothetical protein
MPIFGVTASSNMSTKLTDFYQIATTTVGSGGASFVEFTSIPQDYTHLQIRATSRVNSGDSYQTFAQFNSDTGSNYSIHYIYGNGSGVFSGAGANQTSASVGSSPGSSSSANVFGITVCDILDYRDTNKFKTTRAISGAERGATPSYVFDPSGNWRSTNAITSIKLYPESGASFVQHSTFQLYGIKA